MEHTYHGTKKTQQANQSLVLIIIMIDASRQMSNISNRCTEKIWINWNAEGWGSEALETGVVGVTKDSTVLMQVLPNKTSWKSRTQPPGWKRLLYRDWLGARYLTSLNKYPALRNGQIVPLPEELLWSSNEIRSVSCM